MLKDYGKYYLTSQTELQNTVRDLNVKLFKRKTIQDLDFRGF